MSQIELQTVHVASLKTYARNARHHSHRQIRAIAASIDEFGVTNPPLIDEQGEIIAGHGRVAAAQTLGMSTMQVIRISGLSETQKKALRLADNRIALGSTWSVENLAAELEELTTLDLDITLTGFDAIEVDKLITPSLSAEAAERPSPALTEKPVSRTGDVWALGEHLITVGDARDPDCYSRVVGWRRADLVLTDPPWNVRVKGHVSGKGRTAHSEFQMASGEMSETEFRDFLEDTLGRARGASRDGSLHYIFMDWRSIGILTAVGGELFSQLMNICVWCKSNGGMGSFYRSQHELVAVFKHGEAPHINNIQLGRLGRYRSNVWQYPGASSFSRTRKRDLEDHPTVKPTALVADAIRDATKPGDLVLDPFGGSGTTLMAAELTKRRAALIEIDPRYVDVTLRRFHEQIGIEPVLLPNRKTLSAVRIERAELPEKVA